jgi:hypothetical protein
MSGKATTGCHKGPSKFITVLPYRVTMTHTQGEFLFLYSFEKHKNVCN